MLRVWSIPWHFPPMDSMCLQAAQMGLQSSHLMGYKSGLLLDATGSSDETAKLWTLDGTKVRSFDVKSVVNSVAFSPNGQHVLTGSSDGTAKLWTLDGIQERSFIGRVSFDGSHYKVNSVAFSPDGQYVLTAGGRDAKLWTLDGREIQNFRGHESFVTTVAFSPDGQYILTGCFDGTTKLWMRWDHILESGLIASMNDDD